MKRLYFAFVLFCTSNILLARSLVSSADQLSSETSKIALGLALFGLILAGIYFVLGKNDAGTKITNALLGLGIIVLAPSILTFVKGLA